MRYINPRLIDWFIDLFIYYTCVMMEQTLPLSLHLCDVTSERNRDFHVDCSESSSCCWCCRCNCCRFRSHHCRRCCRTQALSSSPFQQVWPLFTTLFYVFDVLYNKFNVNYSTNNPIVPDNPPVYHNSHFECAVARKESWQSCTHSTFFSCIVCQIAVAAPTQ